MMNELPVYFALVLCLMLSFVLSGMEAGVFAMNRLRMRRLARAGNKQAQVLHGFIERPEKFLWTILVGNTLVNFVILGWALTRLHGWLLGHGPSVVVLFTIVVFLFYAFFVLLPKMLYRTYPNRLCLSSANVIRLVSLALSPVVSLAEGISNLTLRWRGSRAFTGRVFGNREEMRAAMAEAAQALTSDEHVMINRVLDLQNFTVAKITLTLDKVYAAEMQTPVRDLLALAREKNLSRLPVWQMRDGRRRIAGLVDVTALIFRDNLDLSKTAAELMTPALFLEEGTRLEIALRRMQRAGQRLAIVLGRNGNEVGVVSLEDILKLMFGEVKL
jgi:CBS domain containing-hemolysin-like protein